ncbi:MAG: hypothetical protein ACI3ZQ_06005 [Candidatus Cryptobacteroides sp.]
MTCRKGDFYIIKKGFVPQKVSGYIVDEKIGFCRNESGEFYPTEIESGMGLAVTKWDMIIIDKYNGVYNLLNAYRAYKELYCDEYVGLIDKLLREPDTITLKCVKAIKKAYEAEKVSDGCL